MRHTHTCRHTGGAQGLQGASWSITRVLFSLRGTETEEEGKQARGRKTEEIREGEAENEVKLTYIRVHFWEHWRMFFCFFFLVLDVIRMCVFKPSPECVSACVFSLCCLEDRRDYRDGHCAQASIWFLTHLFLVPYCLSIRHNGSQDSSPFYCDWRPVWRKKWKSISGSLFPGSWFWTQRTKTVFKEWNHFKGKRKSLCLQLSFSSLLFILAGTMWFSVGIWERGNNAFQVTWKVK